MKYSAHLAPWAAWLCTLRSKPLPSTGKDARGTSCRRRHGRTYIELATVPCMECVRAQQWQAKQTRACCITKPAEASRVDEDDVELYLVVTAAALPLLPHIADPPWVCLRLWKVASGGVVDGECGA